MITIGQDKNTNITIVKFNPKEVSNKQDVYSLVIRGTSLFLNEEEFGALKGLFGALSET